MQFLNFRKPTMNEILHLIASFLILTACIYNIPFRAISFFITPNILFTTIITIVFGSISAVRIFMGLVDFCCSKYVYHRNDKDDNKTTLHLLSIHNYKQNIKFHEGKIVNNLINKIDKLIISGHNITIYSHLLKPRHIKLIKLVTDEKVNNGSIIIDVKKNIPVRSRLIIKCIFIFFYWYNPKIKKTGMEIYIKNTNAKESLDSWEKENIVLDRQKDKITEK